MPSMSDIRFHIKSVKQTRQITNAMHLVSAARVRKAMRGIEQNRAYFTRAFAAMKDIRSHPNGCCHPYITHREGAGKAAYIVIAGEKGLSGSYNNDVLAVADEGLKTHDVTHIFAVGMMAAAHLRKYKAPLDENFVHIAEKPSINTVRRLTGIIMDLYDAKEIDEVHVVYTRFVNSLTHEPIDVKLLPIELCDFCTPDEMQHEERGEMLYEPSPDEVFHALVPQYIIGYLYGALVHSYASENYACMTAMENATRSADEMIEKLTQQYHSVRQLSITNELSEIVSAANALGQGQ
jgi:F-type H+-transporting ATPase subunit gamma